MIEQSKRNGPVYYSEAGEKLISKKIPIPDIKFGKPIEVLFRQKDNIIEVEPIGAGYSLIYLNGQYIDKGPSSPRGFRYLAGIAEYEEKKTPYFIQNTPPVTLEDTLDIYNMMLPVSLTGYSYQQTFVFPEELLPISGDLPATYVDYYKRPMNPELLTSGVYIPIGIDMVKTTVSEIARIPRNFPIVVNLVGTDYAVIDLEPGYTEDDLQEAESYSYIYKEDTVRGGKHYLIRTTEKGFKYRASKHLEIINRTMCTFYGINGTVVDLNAPAVSFEDRNYEEVGRQSVTLKEAPEGVREVVVSLKDINLNRPTLGKVRTAYELDSDKSHADYMALRTIFYDDIYTHVPEIIAYGMTKEDLPWVLAEYGGGMIPYREKHDTERRGCPYLVYVAAAVLNHVEL